MPAATHYSNNYSNQLRDYSNSPATASPCTLRPCNVGLDKQPVADDEPLQPSLDLWRSRSRGTAGGQDLAS
jgi:hypothetical protein